MLERWLQASSNQNLHMPIQDILLELFPGQVSTPLTVNDIPNSQYVVYVLAHNDTPIVVSSGQKNRAKILFDTIETKTNSHLKTFKVRVYRLNYVEGFAKFIVQCQNKNIACEREAHLHQLIGGNNNQLPEELKNWLFAGIGNDTIPHLLINLAMLSSFDGLADLKKWRQAGIIRNDVWQIISNKLQLHALGWN